MAEIFKSVVNLISAIAIPTFILVFLGWGLIKKVKVYEVFVEGAKDGFNTAVKIIPYLVAMLFVIFDIEVVFMYPWALQFRDLAMQSPVVLVSMAGFAGTLAIAYMYALKKGALNWKY